MKRKKKTDTSHTKTSRIPDKDKRSRSPQNRGETGEKRRMPPRGRQSRKGVSGNPDGRPRKTKLTDAIRHRLEQVDEKTGVTNATLTAAAIGRRALQSSVEAFKAIGDRAEGKPQKSMEAVDEHKLEPPSLTVVFVTKEDVTNDRNKRLLSSPTPAIDVKAAQIEVPTLAPKV